MKRIIVASLGTAIVMLAAERAYAQEVSATIDMREDPIAAESRAEWEWRHDAIVAEIKQLQEHLWAGAYGQGFGAGVSLKLAPDGGFVFSWTGCLGVYGRSYGTVQASGDGVLWLSPEFEDDHLEFNRVETELIIVSWGDRRYLIPPDEMIDFCNEVNSRIEPFFHAYGVFSRQSGEDCPPETGPTGMPEVPAAFRPYLLAESVEAEIISVDGLEMNQRTHERMSIPGLESTEGEWVSTEVSATVTLDVGREHKILPGMTLDFYGPEACGLLGEVRVVSVEAGTSIATIEGEFAGDSDRCTPAPGWRLTTGSPCDWLGVTFETTVEGESGE